MHEDADRLEERQRRRAPRSEGEHESRVDRRPGPKFLIFLILAKFNFANIKLAPRPGLLMRNPLGAEVTNDSQAIENTSQEKVLQLFETK